MGERELKNTNINKLYCLFPLFVEKIEKTIIETMHDRNTPVLTEQRNNAGK